ncbi:MAG: ABC transporter ATP-binding protein [Desulfobacteraceae bacterium]|nr:ABC transporter ATP-binding protein [Desulfobacteraceae bacterium]
MIEVKGLTFAHKGAAEPVLRDIGFRADSAEVTAVLGPNGSGKTTLFQCLLGVWKAKEGEVRLSGRPIGALTRIEIARRLSSVPQEHDPPFPYSCFDIVLMGRTAHIGVFSSPARKDRALSREAMKALGVDHLAARPYTQVSGGERQMVLIARCLAQDVPAMLLDEPTAHLDFRNQITILKRVKEIVHEKNLVALMNLHDPNMALLFADKVLLLKDGRLLAQGKPHEVITRKSLLEVYGLEVEFISENGFRMICPKI